jgi:hypothetical protein
MCKIPHIALQSYNTLSANVFFGKIANSLSFQHWLQVGLSCKHKQVQLENNLCA